MGHDAVKNPVPKSFKKTPVKYERPAVPLEGLTVTHVSNTCSILFQINPESAWITKSHFLIVISKLEFTRLKIMLYGACL